MSCFGLARQLDRLFFYDLLRIPFGWRALKVPDRDAVEVMPLWLYWPVRLRRDRYHLVFGTLMRLGLWAVKEEGGYYVDGYWTCPLPIKRALWCFLNDADRSPPQMGRFLSNEDRAELERLAAKLAEQQRRHAEYMRGVSHFHFITKNGFLARIEYR